MSVRFHLVCGSTGAGKTTYSIALSDRIGGVRFSIDEWMGTLFGKDVAEPIQFSWMIERVHRCETQIGRIALRCAGRGLPVVLDLGFTRADQRARLAALARDAGHEAVLHFLDVPAETRWSRVEARNRDRGDTFSIEVTRPMFDFVEGMWEPPTPDEMSALNGVRVA
jgi:predicted kinase